jgi:hypothetical protein
MSDDMRTFMLGLDPTDDEIEFNPQTQQVIATSRTTGRSQLFTAETFDRARSPREFDNAISVPDEWRYRNWSNTQTIDILRQLPHASVVRWIDKVFHYVAIKIQPLGWYTSATVENEHVDQVVTNSVLAGMLHDEQFYIGTRWEAINNEPPF